jgi:hypothetical protein
MKKLTHITTTGKFQINKQGSMQKLTMIKSVCKDNQNNFENIMKLEGRVPTSQA